MNDGWKKSMKKQLLFCFAFLNAAAAILSLTFDNHRINDAVSGGKFITVKKFPT